MGIAVRKFALLCCVGSCVMLMALAPNTWPFSTAPGAPAPTATPQVTMNPFNVVMGDQGSNFADMGPTPDAFVAQADWNQEPVNTGNTNYCGTTTQANCTTFKYIDHLKNFCATTQTVVVLSPAPPGAGLPATFAPGTSPPQGAETWFTHQYPSNPTPAAPATPFRGIAITTGASCAAFYAAPTPTPVSGVAISSHPFQMNPDDTGFQGFLQNNVWNQTGNVYYPQTQNATTPPYNVYEDNSGIMGNGITGGASLAQPYSTEYGCGFNGGKTCRIDQQGSGTDTPGPFAVADAYTVAVGKWANSACPGSPCLKMRLNGASPIAGQLIGCNIFHGTNDCNDKSITGYIDNTYEKAINSVIVANTAHNIKGFDFESPIFDHNIGHWGTPAELAAVLNTWIQFQNDASNNGVTLTDLEPGWGSGGVGSLLTDVRTMSIGMEWLAPDPNGTTSSNDRIVPERLPIGATQTEAPSFFELFLVPFAPENIVPTYSYNTSKNVTNGGGCPSTGGDSGGIISLLKQCASDSGGVYVLQYKQLWFNSHNYGPMAVIVNTSGTDTITISSSWFLGESLASYGFALKLAAGEMTSVAQGNIGGGVATFTTCSNVTYCLGSNNTMALNTTATIPTTIGPHSAVILVTTNS